MAGIHNGGPRVDTEALLGAARAQLGPLLGHDFRNFSHVEQALTHSSAKSTVRPSNERMEFFGDAVIGLIVTELVYHEYPDYPEGEMTRVKSTLVSREMLAEKALHLRLNEFALIGKGVGARDALPRSILANLFEAVIAALYLDAGYDACKQYLTQCFREDIAPILGHHITRNYKSALQQLAQSHMGATPVYSVLSESGPDHDKRFVVAAGVNGEQLGSGTGASKKEAEQAAARNALKALLSRLDLGDDDAALLMELPDDDDEHLTGKISGS